jgi:ABC-type sugar transport system permease subunit
VWQIFRHIKFPLLLVSVAPLLISSFAFNFNNFNLIYMLTGGGPRFADASINVGASDILISMVYKVAFVGPNATTASPARSRSSSSCWWRSSPTSASARPRCSRS